MQWMPNLRSVSALCCLILTILLAGPPTIPKAQADPSVGDDPYVAIDAQTLSKKYDVPYESTLARTSEQVDVNKLAVELERLAGIRFAGSYVNEQGAMALNIRLTGESEFEPLERAIKDTPMTVNLRYGAEASMDDKRAFADGNALEAWLSDTSEVMGVIVGERSDSVELLASRDVHIPSSLNSLAKSLGIAISVRRVEGTAGDTNRGGRNMTSCTSGFVYSDGGPNQLVLARHCLAQSYFFFNGDGPFATQYTGMAYNANADLQWRKPVEHVGQGTFYADSTTGNGRNQLGQSHGLSGESVCRRGKTTGYDCGTIFNTSYKPTYAGACPSGPCNSTFALVEDTYVQGGDSGGPWFLGGYAYGITKGYTASYSIYSKLGYLPAGLDIVIP